MTTQSDVFYSLVRLNIVIFVAADFVCALCLYFEGGKKFCTTVDTLTQREPDSMLAAMFSGRHTVCRDSEKGYVFVDRDGKHFRHILNWLRDGVVPTLTDTEYSELLREAEYYQLIGLIDGINASLDKRKENEELDTELTRTDIIKCIQSERVRFRGVNLSGLDLSKLDLSFVDFSYACLKSVFFLRANLQCAKFRGRYEFTGANLRAALLAGANLQSANLQDACLIDCSFCGADLCSAHLQSADLTNANLEGANLEGANLKGVKLSNANLKGANLQRAYLRHVNLRETVQGLMVPVCLERSDDHQSVALIFIQCRWHQEEILDEHGVQEDRGLGTQPTQAPSSSVGSTSFTKSVRGPTQGLGLNRLIKKTKQPMRVIVDLDQGRPLDCDESAKLSSECGIIARYFLPHNQHRYADINERDKEEAFYSGRLQ